MMTLSSSLCRPFRRLNELSPTDDINVFCDETKIALDASYCECLGNPLEGLATADCAQGDNTVKLIFHDGVITETEFCLPETDPEDQSMYHVCVTEYRIGDKACEGFLLRGGAREQDDCDACSYSDELCPEGEQYGIELSCPFSKLYDQLLPGAICVKDSDGSSDLTIVYTNATLPIAPSNNGNNNMNNDQPNKQGNPTYTAIYNASGQDLTNGVIVMIVLCCALVVVGYLGKRAFHRYCASIQPHQFLGEVEMGDTPRSRRRRMREKKLKKKESSDYSTVEQSDEAVSVASMT